MMVDLTYFKFVKIAKLEYSHRDPCKIAEFGVSQNLIPGAKEN